MPDRPSQRPFGRHARLRTRAQLAYVRRNGVKRVGALCLITAAPPPDEQRRMVTIVSRRYSRHAVVRNRARRLLREAYRRVLPQLKPTWLVMIPRYRMQRAKMGDVLSELMQLLEGAGLIEPGASIPEDVPREKS